MGRKATPAQLAALAKGRAKLRARRKQGLARRGPKKKGAGFFGDVWGAVKGAGKMAIDEGLKEGKKRLGKAGKAFLGGGVKGKRPMRIVGTAERKRRKKKKKGYGYGDLTSQIGTIGPAKRMTRREAKEEMKHAPDFAWSVTGTAPAGGLKGKVTATDRKKMRAIVAPVKRAHKALVKAKKVATRKHKALATSIKKRVKRKKR